MMHPDTEVRFISDAIGYGVFALRTIPRGTITWITDPLDQKFTREQVELLPSLCRQAVYHYAYIDPAGMYVLCWDHGTYVNHSCEPNCLSAGFQFEFAIRHIAAGEQLTDEYCLLNPKEPMDCHCGSPRCRGRISRDDIQQAMPAWDSIVSESFGFIGKVDQPLWPLLANAAEIEAVLRGELPIPSCAFLLARD
jgi:hypothetical protein